MAELPPLSVLIVDDEAPARTRLRDVLSDVAQRQPTQLVGMAANGDEALRLLAAQPAHVVLADIRMPGMDGVALARALQALPQPPVVIFTTAYDEYAVQAFELAATDYLLKPVRAQRLEAALARARAQCQGLLGADASRTTRKHFSVTERGRIVLVPVAEVRYLKAELKYVSAVTAACSYVLDESLVQLEQEFPERFLRIHRSCLVNRDAVMALERIEAESEGGWAVVLHGSDERLPISRRQWPLIKAQLQAVRA